MIPKGIKIRYLFKVKRLFHKEFYMIPHLDFKKDFVKRGDPIFTLESSKIDHIFNAPITGYYDISGNDGTPLPINKVIFQLSTDPDSLNNDLNNLKEQSDKIKYLKMMLSAGTDSVFDVHVKIEEV